MSNTALAIEGVADGAVRRTLERTLEGRELAIADAVTLGTVRGRDLLALCAVADELRLRQVGDVVTYVVNRNINFTNVCVKSCRFCAFSRTVRSGEGYMLPVDEVVERAVEARRLGATEVCLQAGLAPLESGRYYVELCAAVHRAVPELHIHAFSPEEVKYGAQLCGVTVGDYLIELKEAGLGSLPGTSAEVLDDRIRHRISPGRITTAEWTGVIRAAHGLGIPTTSTLMFGHVERFEDCVRHMDLLRGIQRDTGGFTEFVPLSFVHHEAPLFAGEEGLPPGPTGDDVIRLHAVARLMLGSTIPNLQVSWVKEGMRLSQWLLHCGVNDLGGTLVNESISTSAGASHGQLVSPAELRRVIRDAGRVPAERATCYEVLRRFDDPGNEAPSPLDGVDDVERAFGSYERLVADERHRFTKPGWVGRARRG